MEQEKMKQDGVQIKQEGVQIKQEDVQIKQEIVEIEQGGVQIKQEPVEKTEVSIESEYQMSKEQLIQLHRLEPLQKGAEGKKNGVLCPWCSCTFEGRNRAKIFQHTSGVEHRRRWKVGITKDGEQKQELEQRAADAGLELGTCGGCRLGSSLGRATRLGSDTRPVFETYSQFASLDWTVFFWGGSCCTTKEV